MTPFDLPPEWNKMVRQMRRVGKSPELGAALANVRKLQLSPVARERMAVVAEQARQATQEWEQTFARTLAPTLEQWRIQLPKIQVQYPPMLVEAARRAAEQWREAIPPNWAELDPGEMESVIDRVRDTGFCLVWIPRTDILREVLAAEPKDTGTVLLAHLDEVLDDADASLADCSQPDFELERDAAREAIETLRSGRSRAAQALASSVFTSTVHVYFEIGTKKIRKMIMAEADPMETGSGRYDWRRSTSQPASRCRIFGRSERGRSATSSTGTTPPIGSRASSGRKKMP